MIAANKKESGVEWRALESTVAVEHGVWNKPGRPREKHQLFLKKSRTWNTASNETHQNPCLQDSKNCYVFQVKKTPRAQPFFVLNHHLGARRGVQCMEKT